MSDITELEVEQWIGVSANNTVTAMMGTGTPLTCALVVAIWRDSRGWHAAPNLLGDASGFDFLVYILKTLIEKLDAREWETETKAPGGDA